MSKGYVFRGTLVQLASTLVILTVLPIISLTVWSTNRVYLTLDAVLRVRCHSLHECARIETHTQRRTHTQTHNPGVSSWDCQLDFHPTYHLELQEESQLGKAMSMMLENCPYEARSAWFTPATPFSSDKIFYPSSNCSAPWSLLNNCSPLSLGPPSDLSDRFLLSLITRSSSFADTAASKQSKPFKTHGFSSSRLCIKLSHCHTHSGGLENHQWLDFPFVFRPIFPLQEFLHKFPITSDMLSFIRIVYSFLPQTRPESSAHSRKRWGCFMHHQLVLCVPVTLISLWPRNDGVSAPESLAVPLGLSQLLRTSLTVLKSTSVWNWWKTWKANILARNRKTNASLP